MRRTGRTGRRRSAGDGRKRRHADDGQKRRPVGDGGKHRSTERAQAHTVEAFVAALLLISGLLFAMQATAVTPLSASTSNQHIENQQRALAGDLLATGVEDGSLKETLLYWKPQNESFQGAEELGFYSAPGAETEFLAAAEQTFGSRQIAYSISVRYHRVDEVTNTPSMKTSRMVYMGRPSDNAVTASRTVTLYDDDQLTGTNTSSLGSLPEGAFYAPDVGDGLVYNRVEVRITTWRM